MPDQWRENVKEAAKGLLDLRLPPKDQHTPAVHQLGVSGPQKAVVNSVAKAWLQSVDSPFLAEAASEHSVHLQFWLQARESAIKGKLQHHGALYFDALMLGIVRTRQTWSMRPRLTDCCSCRSTCRVLRLSWQVSALPLSHSCHQADLFINL
jgi:hypothetical protein